MPLALPVPPQAPGRLPRTPTFTRERHSPPKDARSAIYAAILFGSYPDGIRATKLPSHLFQALALIGRALRFEI
jgi:hypothetical protein